MIDRFDSIEDVSVPALHTLQLHTHDRYIILYSDKVPYAAFHICFTLLMQCSDKSSCVHVVCVQASHMKDMIESYCIEAEKVGELLTLTQS